MLALTRDGLIKAQRPGPIVRLYELSLKTQLSKFY